MELAKVSVGLPILRLECEAEITIRGEPTAFERMVLKLVERFEEDPEYNHLPLFALFRDFLGVADPDRLLAATVNDLVSIDLLTCRQETREVREMSVADLGITARGRQVLANRMLPFRAQCHDRTFYYDPVGSGFLSQRQAQRLSQDAPQIHIDATLFEDIWPEQAVRQGFEKLQEQRTIARLVVGNVRRRGLEMLWRNVQASIGLDGGRFSVRFEDAAVGSYVRSLPDDSVASHLLRPALIGPRIPQKAMSKWQEADPEDADAATAWAPLSRVNTHLMTSARVLMLDRESDFTDSHTEVPRRRLRICYELSNTSPPIETNWSTDGSGCLLRVNGPYPFESAVVANQDTIVRGRMVRIQGMRGDFRFPLAILDKTDSAADEIAAAIAKVAALLREHRPDEEARIREFWTAKLSGTD
jgi:hypothetical protein